MSATQKECPQSGRKQPENPVQATSSLLPEIEGVEGKTAAGFDPTCDHVMIIIVGCA
jgi:hypothetical protein